MIEDKEILFKETQRFTQWWLWMILGGILGFQLLGFVRQVFLGLPFGDNPLSNGGLIGLNIFLLALLIFFWQFALKLPSQKMGCILNFSPFISSLDLFLSLPFQKSMSENTVL